MTKGKLLDLIYDRVDSLMGSGKIAQLDKMFRFSRKTDPDLMIGLLTASLPVKSQLPSRAAYLKAVSVLCKDSELLHALA